MDWKKIRQAVRTVLAAVLICAASVGITGDPAYAADMGAVYGIYEHGTGWSGYHGDSKTARAGTGSYVTAIRASLQGQPEGMSGTLSYQVNLSGSGWLSWQENMTPNGSTETDMPLEAVRMAFTGQLAENYDVYYSVYQNGSWTTPVKNGETAGTEGQGLRVDGLWVTVTGKGAEVPEGPNGKSVDPTRPMVALTFDDGPGVYTSTLLDTLEQYGAQATFFMLGSNVEKYGADVIPRMAAIGCELGNHSYAHPNMKELSTDDGLAQFQMTDDLIAQYNNGQGATVIRFPYGNSTDELLASIGRPSIMWDVDTLDWQTKNVQANISAVLDSVSPGDIILMHDIHETTVESCATIVPELINRGYELVTIHTLAAANGVDLSLIHI